ncbi:MAG: hypothetical protein IPH11_15920 [Ignavibacteriales bacterium]|nr:hypothetical protein [Ignavibacteriales bacterium]
MKKLFVNLFTLILIIIFLTSIQSFAQNINDALRLGYSGLGANARALGMGNSYIGLSDDGSASFFNPAGFGLLKRLEFSGGLAYSNFNNNTTFFGNNSEYSNSSTNLNRLSFVFPFPTLRGSLVFGLSYHTTSSLIGALQFDGFNSSDNSMITNLLSTDVPYDLYLTDENNVSPIHGDLNQSGTVISSGSVDYWTLSGAVELVQNLYVGLNLNIVSGAFEQNNDYYEDDTKDIYFDTTAAGEAQTVDFKTFYLNRLLNWELAGWNAKLGLIYQLNNIARFGATIQFPKTFSIKEDFTVNGSSEFGTGQIIELDPTKYSDKVEYDIITPFEFAAGFSAGYAGIIFSAEGTLIDYTQMKFDNPNGLTEQYISEQNKSIKEKLEAVINYNLGIEYTIPNLGLRLRAGYFIQSSAFKNDNSDYDKKYITAGLGFLAAETLGIDIGYAHGWWNDFGDNYGDNVSRTIQEITLDNMVMTATYRF